MLICVYDEKTKFNDEVSCDATFVDCTEDGEITEGLIRDNWDRFIKGGTYILKGKTGYDDYNMVYDVDIPLEAKSEIEKRLYKAKCNKKYSSEQSNAVMKLLGIKVSLNVLYELLDKFGLKMYTSEDTKIGDAINTAFIYKGVDAESENEVRWISIVDALKNARNDKVDDVSDFAKYKIVDVDQIDDSSSRYNYLISVLEDMDDSFADRGTLRCYVKDRGLDVFTYEVDDDGETVCEKYDYDNIGALTSSLSNPEILSLQQAEEEIFCADYEIGFIYNMLTGSIEWVN